MNFDTIIRQSARKTVTNTAIVVAIASLIAGCGGGGGSDLDGASTTSAGAGAAPAASAPAASLPAAGSSGTPAPSAAAPGMDTGTATGTPPAQAASTTLVVGRVTDAANLTVKRARYDARNASVRVDYADSSPSEIKLGMIVEIEAETSSSGTSVARSVAIHSFVEGRIERIDVVGRMLVVNGVTVSVPADTVFEGINGWTDPNLRIGDAVEVHGYASATGGTATRIEKKAQDDDSRITGTVTNLNTATRTFTLYGKTISYDSAKLDDLPTGLADNMLVRVKGFQNGPAVYTATEVRSANGSSASSTNGSRSEQEGIVTAFNSISDLVVNGLRVDASGAEVKGAIGRGTRVEVEGVLRAGVLVASKLENKDNDDSRGSGSQETELRGTVSSLNAMTRSFLLGGVTVTWDETTEFDDVSAASLANNMFLEVEGLASASGLRAQKIKLED